LIAAVRSEVSPAEGPLVTWNSRQTGQSEPSKAIGAPTQPPLLDPRQSQSKGQGRTAPRSARSSRFPPRLSRPSSPRGSLFSAGLGSGAFPLRRPDFGADRLACPGLPASRGAEDAARRRLLLRLKKPAPPLKKHEEAPASSSPPASSPEETGAASEEAGGSCFFVVGHWRVIRGRGGTRLEPPRLGNRRLAVACRAPACSAFSRWETKGWGCERSTYSCPNQDARS
jgi:hypothetical protein